MAPPSAWPDWIRYTLTAMAGVVSTLVVVTLSFADVRANAARGAALEPRVSEHDALIREMKAEATSDRALLVEVRADVKQLLQRVPR